MLGCVGMAKDEGEGRRSEKLISLPDELWEIIDEDARRSRRSRTKQIEMILASTYRFGEPPNSNTLAAREAELEIHRANLEDFEKQMAELLELVSKTAKMLHGRPSPEQESTLPAGHEERESPQDCRAP